MTSERADIDATTGSTVASTTASNPPTTATSTVPDTEPPTEQTSFPPPPGLVPTADGAGDLLFPGLGNPGIDVLHYDVQLSYDPDSDQLEGTVGIDVVLTEDRTAITLDADGPVVDAVIVDGTAVAAVVDGNELRIPLSSPSSLGTTLRLEVQYSLAPSPSGSPIGLPNGWFNTPGGSYVLNEPDGASKWLPCNDHPSDKATFTFTIEVPQGMTAVANGALIEQRTDGDRDVWVWNQTQPMTTYLIQLLTGDYEIVSSTGPGGLPLVSAILRDDLATMQPFLDATPEMIEFFEGLFGPYPLDRYGLAISDSFGGLAMETQGRSLFSREDFESGEMGGLQHTLLSHELAHQYFGDSVSPQRWQDIWLNEGFATYSEWLWMEHARFFSVDDMANGILQQRPPGSSADPTVEELFGFNSYSGAGVILHALRLTVGDDAFFELLGRWAAENHGTSRSTEEFVDFAEDVAGRSLTDFFATWLYATQLPTEFPAG